MKPVPSDIGLTKRALANSRIANELVVAEDGQEALDYLFGNGQCAGRGVSNLPALAPLDLKLPCVDGLDSCARSAPIHAPAANRWISRHSHWL
jgi:two-component system response regulator